MSWDVKFRVREYLRGSLWVLPLIGAVLGGVFGTGALALDERSDLPEYFTYSPSTATSVLAAIVGATAALAGFVITVTVLVVQMATGTFSARYMRLWYRDRMLKATLAVLVGTMTFALWLLRRVEADSVPDPGVTARGDPRDGRPAAVPRSSSTDSSIASGRSPSRARGGCRARDIRRDARGPAGGRHLARALPTDEEPALLVRSCRAGSIQAFDTEGW